MENWQKKKTMKCMVEKKQVILIKGQKVEKNYQKNNNKLLQHFKSFSYDLP